MKSNLKFATQLIPVTGVFIKETNFPEIKKGHQNFDDLF